jgi:hypothetical protein
MEMFNPLKRWYVKKRFRQEHERVYKRMSEHGVNESQINILINDESFMQQVVEIARDFAKKDGAGQADAQEKLLKMGDTKSLVALALMNEAIKRNLNE